MAAEASNPNSSIFSLLYGHPVDAYLFFPVVSSLPSLDLSFNEVF
jgi:hypothetical protein